MPGVFSIEIKLASLLELPIYARWACDIFVLAGNYRKVDTIVSLSTCAIPTFHDAVEMTWLSWQATLPVLDTPFNKKVMNL